METIFLMLKVRLMLWLIPFSRIQNSLKGINIIKNEIPVFKLIWAVKVASNYLPSATCLTNALTGYSLLLRYGYPSLVKIGVGKSAGGFEAHAWLEYNGKVVIGESEKNYISIFDIKDDLTNYKT